MSTRHGTAALRSALVVALAGEAALFAAYLLTDKSIRALVLVAWAAPLWVAAVLLFSKLRWSKRGATLLVLGAGAALQLIAIGSHPSTSDDDFRYVWDAKVQLSGVDPYRYAPVAPQLEHVRDPFLFGDPPCAHPIAGGCTSINRPTVHTIYPPVAEGAFVAVRLASFGGHGGHLPLQLAGALGSLIVGWLLLRRGRDRPWPAALWTWSPLVVLEYGNNAHIDWLAVLLVVLALTVRSVWSAGALVGAAIAVKLYPALVLPSIMRRSWVAGVAAVALVVVVYVPHVIAVGSAVIGYLPGYLHEEQYGSGDRLHLLATVLPHPIDTVAGAVIVAAVAVWAWRFASGPPERSAVVVVGVAFAVFTPSYGWYAGLLLALVAMSGAIEWIPLVLAPMLAYLSHGHDTEVYAVAVLAVVALAVTRWSASRRRDGPADPRRPRRTVLRNV